MPELDNIHRVTIVGIGTQGSMIAFRNALYGKTVVGYSRTEASIQTCKNKIEKWLAYFMEEGRLSQEEADALRSRISYSPHPGGGLQGRQLVVENVPGKN